MKGSVKHLEVLDYARGVAIIAVVLFHTLAHVYWYDELPWHGWIRGFPEKDPSFLFLLPCCFGRTAGVAIFFVVSGFCIHMSFQREAQSWGGFFLRRFFRIYPPYLAALFFSVLMLPMPWRDIWSSDGIREQWLTHLLLVHNFRRETLMAINGPFWSLAVEAQLYALYPLLLYFAGSLGWRTTLVALAGIEFLIRGVDGTVQTLGANETAIGHISWLMSYSPFGFWFSWSIGAYLAEAYLKNQPMPRFSPMPWALLAVISYFIKPFYAFQFLWFAILTAVLLANYFTGSVSWNIPPSPLKILKKIGLWSYSIYLLHQPILNLFPMAIRWAAPQIASFGLLVFLLFSIPWAFIIMLGAVWHSVFELPAIAIGKYLVRQPALVTPKIARGSLPAALPATAMALLILTAGTIFLNRALTGRPPGENNNAAWALATNPDAAKRNGALAVKLAEEACKQTQYQQTIMVGTLAAAYAEAGRFDEAISTAIKACELAEKNGETNLLQSNQQLLKLYQNHQPYHETRLKETKPLQPPASDQ